MNLTIGYITARETPRIEWFFDSLAIQLSGLIPVKPSLVVVDLHAHKRVNRIPPPHLRQNIGSFFWIEPKPSVWHGRYRLTKHDFFSASNCRNTVLALAPDGIVAFVDDLSVLTPQWIEPIKELLNNPDRIICGSFQKVKQLKVESGKIISFEEYDAGKDSRWNMGDDTVDISCPPNWLFGCSLAGPVKAFIDINGYPEDLCDGMGYEDCITGMAMARNGWRFCYSRRMKTLESEEDHHNQSATLRFDPGKSPEDKSHAMLKKAEGWKWFPQNFGKTFDKLSDLRQHMLSGGKFPIRKHPEKEWYTGIPLSEFHDYHSSPINTKS